MSNKLIGIILEKYGFTNKEYNFLEMRNKEFLSIFDTVDNELNKILNAELAKYNFEEYILSLQALMSITSKITINTYDKKYDVGMDNSELGNVINLFKEVANETSMDMRMILGKIKSPFELLINYSLIHDEVIMKNSPINSKINYQYILITAISKIMINEYKKGIGFVGEYREEFKFSKEKGIIFPPTVGDSLANYFSNTSNGKLKVGNAETEDLFIKFKNVMGFNYMDAVNYLLDDDKDLDMSILLNVVTKDFLYNDLMRQEDISEEAAHKLVDLFILNDQNMEYENNVNKLLFNDNFRFAKTSIMQTENFFIISAFTWMEAVLFIEKRILNREVLMKDDKMMKSWNQDLKSANDEYELRTLVKMINTKNINAIINIDLTKYFEKLKNVKGIPHEIDLAYIYRETLYIWDLKNYQLQFNYSEIHFLNNEIKKEKRKLNKLKAFLDDNLIALHKFVNEDFQHITCNILTVGSTAYKYLPKDEGKYNQQVLSVDDLKRVIDYY